MRLEQEIFDDLAKLCASPGYVHAIAYICFRDKIILYAGDMKPENMQHLFSMERLIRTETSTLIGLLVKNNIDYSLPVAEVMQHYLEKTDALLKEIHESMLGPWRAAMAPKKITDESDSNEFATGAALREPIFYGAESAYSSQYRDLSLKKYQKDDEWLKANKRFSIQIARDVVYAIGRRLNDKSTDILEALKNQSKEEFSTLSCFEFTTKEVVGRTGLDSSVVEDVLNAFSVPENERNNNFFSLHDYNVANALPLIRVRHGVYLLFDIYSLVESLYESPFYWMGADKVYEDAAMVHRGIFTEEFAAERLALVFGKNNVYLNVDIFKSKKTKVGEIDVLVLFGDRAIVLQAKSKRLTLEARRGNDGQIRDDFKKSIQKSYDQGYACAELLSDDSYTFKDADSKEIIIPATIKRTYVLCVISDHYPALSFQVRQFLKIEAAETISPPFVLDVFTLDVMTEMLDSPLYMLSYLDRRTTYFHELMASNELVILSFHLKQNLWLEEKYNIAMMTDDIATDLDLAMLVRRDGVSGKRTPDGILTRMASTTVGRLIKHIDARPDPATIELGLMLLTLSEDTIVTLSKGIDELVKRAKKDGKVHDLTMGFGTWGTGLTVHCSSESIQIAGPRLQAHCARRKYTERADTWFGICVDPINTTLRFGTNLNFKWEHSEDMVAITKNMGKPGKLQDLLKSAVAKNKNIGRNDSCPCGSGKKYKKCCLN